MENFNFYSPTFFAFGKDRESDCGELVKRFGGSKVLIHFGGGSVVRSGLLDRVKKSLEAEDIAYCELGGVMPNPRSGLVYKGIELCKKENVDFILAVGGGSTIDSSKALQAGTKQGYEIPEADRDYYLERRYPAFGNLVPRDVASRAAKERCDKGFGVNNTGLAVFLDFSESIQRLGIDEIRQRYGNLFDMYEEITDVNPGQLARTVDGIDYYYPMMIFPAIHYTMGGIWVDYELQTSIPGLFAIGECNFSDHGANRLGASALMQGLADGYFVLPYTIQNYLSDQIQVPRFSTDLPEFEAAEKAVKEKIAKIMSINGKRSVDSIHKELGHIMWEYVGMGRTEQSLKTALEKLDKVEKTFWSDLRVPGDAQTLNVELEKALRLLDFIEIGKLMAYDGLNREESCGGHFREEHQTPEGEALRHDDQFSYVACWNYQGEGKAPELLKEPLNYEYIKVQTRNYKN